MKKLIFILFSFLILISFTSYAHALSIAVVNMQKVFQNCEASKNAKSELKQLIETKKLVIARKRREVKKLLGEINSNNVSKKEKSQHEASYQKALNDLKNYEQQAQREIITKERTMSAKIVKGIIVAVKKYAKNKSIDVVFNINQGGVIYWNDAIDITNNILKDYNKTYKKSK